LRKKGKKRGIKRPGFVEKHGPENAATRERTVTPKGMRMGGKYRISVIKQVGASIGGEIERVRIGQTGNRKRKNNGGGGKKMR